MAVKHSSLTGVELHQPFHWGLDANKPTSPAVGDWYFATDTNQLWRCMTAGVWSLDAHLDLSGNVVADLADITSPGADIEDAVIKRMLLQDVVSPYVVSGLTASVTGTNANVTIAVGIAYNTQRLKTTANTVLTVANTGVAHTEHISVNTAGALIITTTARAANELAVADVSVNAAGVATAVTGVRQLRLNFKVAEIAVNRPIQGGAPPGIFFCDFDGSEHARIATSANRLFFFVTGMSSFTITPDSVGVQITHPGAPMHINDQTSTATKVMFQIESNVVTADTIKARIEADGEVFSDTAFTVFSPKISDDPKIALQEALEQAKKPKKPYAGFLPDEKYIVEVEKANQNREKRLPELAKQLSGLNKKSKTEKDREKLEQLQEQKKELLESQKRQQDEYEREKEHVANLKKHKATALKHGVKNLADEKRLFGKDISLIAISLARVVGAQEKRIAELEAKLK